MKNILVPTDFSACAGYATNVAIKFATRFNAKIYLLNSQDLPPYWDKLPQEEKAKWATINKSIKDAADSLQQLTSSHPNIHFETATTSKSLPDAVAECVKKQGIDLIVLGSHGASGKNEFFIGSNAQKVIRTVHCPTLVIKEPLKSIEFRNVIFASTFQENAMEPFLFFKNLIKHFIPEVHLVYINKSIFDTPTNVQIEAMKSFEAACSPLICHLHIYPDISVDSGIRSFAEKINADLISISYHERHPVKRMLIGSNVEAVINHAERPVLTIDY